MAKKTYTAICERVGQGWGITVLELESDRVTQAGSLGEVEGTVRDLVVRRTGAHPDDVEVHPKGPLIVEEPSAVRTVATVAIGLAAIVAMALAIRRLMRVTGR